MGWRDFNASHDYIKIGDGESREVIPVGEPDCKLKADGETKSILFAIADIESASCKLLRCGVVLAGKIKNALRGGELAGKVAVTLKREGSGMDDTKYEVVKVRPLDKKEADEVKKIDLIDLESIPVPEGRARRKGGKGKK